MPCYFSSCAVFFPASGAYNSTWSSSGLAISRPRALFAITYYIVCMYRARKKAPSARRSFGRSVRNQFRSQASPPEPITGELYTWENCRLAEDALPALIVPRGVPSSVVRQLVPVETPPTVYQSASRLLVRITVFCESLPFVRSLVSVRVFPRYRGQLPSRMRPAGRIIRHRHLLIAPIVRAETRRRTNE